MKAAQIRKMNHINATEKTEIVSRSLTAWTHTYHEPYKADWGEARAKAKERRWDLMNETR